jgi:glutamate dehydrogenase (NAD(P)+)
VQDLQQYFWDEEQINAKLKELMLKSFHRVRKLAKEKQIPMRLAALSLGVQKVALEKQKRGLYP